MQVPNFYQTIFETNSEERQTFKFWIKEDAVSIINSAIADGFNPMIICELNGVKKYAPFFGYPEGADTPKIEFFWSAGNQNFSIKIDQNSGKAILETYRITDSIIELIDMYIGKYNTPPYQFTTTDPVYIF